MKILSLLHITVKQYITSHKPFFPNNFLASFISCSSVADMCHKTAAIYLVTHIYVANPWIYLTELGGNQENNAQNNFNP